MAEKYIYSSFGLIIKSDIEISEFIPGTGEEDISIFIGKVPDKIEEMVDQAVDYKISRTEFLFFVENVGKYYIKEGRLIIVEPSEGADAAAIKVYLIGTAIGAVLLQRGVLPIHGSSVIINGHAVIFTGCSGAGKSTICAGLREQGFEFFGDDISVVTINGSGLPQVQSSFPMQRLCTDTAEKMGYNKNELQLACKEDNKYVIKDYENFKTGSAELAAIFELSAKDNGEVQLTEVKGVEKLMRITNNIYYFSILKRLGIKEAFFKQCLTVAKNVGFYKLQRPAGKDTVKEQIDKVKMVLGM